MPGGHGSEAGPWREADNRFDHPVSVTTGPRAPPSTDTALAIPAGEPPPLVPREIHDIDLRRHGTSPEPSRVAVGTWNRWGVHVKRHRFTPHPKSGGLTTLKSGLDFSMAATTWSNAFQLNLR